MIGTRTTGTFSLVVLVWVVSASPAFPSPPAPKPGAPDPAGPGKASLALADFEQMAVQGNPTLAQAAARVEAARGRAVQAGLYPNPTVGYEGDEIGNRGRAGQQGGFIDQLIVTGGKLRLNQAKFAQEVTQTEWQALAQQYRVLNGVRMRFYELLARQRLLEVRADLLKVAEDAVSTTQELINVGQANKADFLQARIEARRQRVGLENARTRYLAAWKDLTALVGQPGLPPTPLQGDLAAKSDLPDQEATLAHLLEASPEVRIAQVEVTRNQFAVRREQVEPIPNVNVRAGTQYNFETKSQHALVQVGVRLPVFDRNQGNIRAAQADLARSQIEVNRVELALRQRLARAYARYQTAVATVENYRKDVLPDAKEAFDLYLDSFRKRRAAYPQVLVAQRNYFEASVDYVEALEQVRRAEVAIGGLLLVDGLEEPPGPPSEGPQRRRENGGDELGEPLGAGRRLDDRVGNRPRD
jgi:outer membrane protein, heavy metal efflux system